MFEVYILKFEVIVIVLVLVLVIGGPWGRGSALPTETTPHGQVLKATQGSPITRPTRCPYGPLADSKLHQTILRKDAVSVGQFSDLQ